MNRVEFMAELESLLQDISLEERIEALQYYNDYFNDAGEEMEETIIKELGSPAKVAAEVKEGLKINGEDAAGYQKMGYEMVNQNVSSETRKTGKTVLFVLILLCLIPIVGPLLIGLVSVIFGIMVTMVSLVIAAGAIAFAGIVVVVAGFITLFPDFAQGLLVIGIGMILSVVGVIATAGMFKLCMIAFPAVIKGIAWICKKPFEKRKVVA